MNKKSATLKSTTLHIRLPAELRRRLERLAKYEKRNLSQMAVICLESGSHSAECANEFIAADEWARKNPLKKRSA